MDKDWTERNEAFELFYSRLTGEYKGKHFDPTPGIAGYIDDKIVTPTMLRQMDEAYSDHLKAKPSNTGLVLLDADKLPKKMLANQQICPGTMIIDRSGAMVVTQELRGSDVVKIIAEWNQPKRILANLQVCSGSVGSPFPGYEWVKK